MIGRPSISRLPFRFTISSQPCPELRFRTPACAISYHSTTIQRAVIGPQLGCAYRYFSSTTRYQDSSFVNHYEVLRMPPNASKAELKKQFYALSKETHPDRHPDDPKAGERFSQISESYSVLADDDKRRRYDRDFHRVTGAGRGGHSRDSSGVGGSFAGSRPASGLSKRRGTFRGPPPSFYAQGGYGNTSHGQSESSQSQQSARPEPNMGGTFNSQAYTERANTEYDPQTTYRTQTVEDQRRMQRKAAEFAAMQAELNALSDTDFWARFVIVSFVVALTVVVGSITVNMSNAPRGGYTRGDGSKRGEKRNDWAKG